IGKHEADIIVISALPPAAMVHARYLCKRIQAKHPDLEAAIGVWTINIDSRRAAERMTCGENVKVVTTLEQAIEQIQQLAAPFLMTQTPAPAPKTAVS